jgi:uncharacterized protein
MKFSKPFGTPLKIVIPGGNGHLGRILARHFRQAGHFVTILTRRPASTQWRSVAWNGRDFGEWTKEIDGADVVINLAGRSVNCRYHKANRRQMMESRTLSTRVIGQAIGQAAVPPPLWLNASTATIYRHIYDRPMDDVSGELGGGETGAPDAWKFSIDVARSWEAAFFEAETPHTRKVALRSAMVMSPQPGGVFDTLMNLVRFGLGGTLGDGKQFFSWVHERDFIRAIEFLIDRENLHGCVNLAAPNPLPNREFMRELRECWGTSIGLPAPAWLLEIGAVFIRTETELVLKSRRVVPGRLLGAGFKFDYPNWPAAARELVERWRESPSSSRRHAPLKTGNDTRAA